MSPTWNVEFFWPGQLRRRLASFPRLLKFTSILEGKKNKNPPRWSEEWSSLTVRLSCRQWRGKLEVMTVEKDRAGNSGDRRNYVTRKTPSNLPNVKSDIDFKKYLLRFWCWQLPCLEVNSSHSVRLDSVEWSVVMLSKYLDCRQADLYLFKTGTG